MSADDLSPITGIGQYAGQTVEEIRNEAETRLQAERRQRQNEPNRIEVDQRQAARDEEARLEGRDQSIAIQQAKRDLQAAEGRIIQARDEANRQEAIRIEEHRLERQALTNSATQAVLEQQGIDRQRATRQAVSEQIAVNRAAEATRLNTADAIAAAQVRIDQTRDDQVAATRAADVLLDRNARVQQEELRNANAFADANLNTVLGDKNLPRPDLSPLQNDARENEADKIEEPEPRVDPAYAPYGPTLMTTLSGENPEIDTRLLEHDLFDNPEGTGEAAGEMDIVAELYALRTTLQREIERIDRILGKLP